MKPLKRIYIEITNICNLSCSFCPASNRDKEVMSVDHFHHIIQQAAVYTDHVYLHVKGEPLLHPELDLILRLCNEYNLKVNHQHLLFSTLHPAIVSWQTIVAESLFLGTIAQSTADNHP